jgi:prolyl-tRNA editing enzyme YbaK/EbsC (Cys-tRNA(Pro) deacylase)
MKSEEELKNKGVIFESIILTQVVHSVHDVQMVCKCRESEVMKTLVFVGNNPIIVIMPGSKKANIAKIERYTGEKNLRMAKPSEVISITDYTVGSVSPFGINPKVKQIADDSVRNLPFLFLGSGKGNTLIKLNQVEFKKAFQGVFAPVSD